MAMARGPVLLPQGMSISEDVTLGVLVRGVPVSIIDQVLRETNRQSVRERALPARFMVYFVMAMTLFFQASYLEVQRKLFAALRWLSLVDRGRGRQERDHDGPPAARPGTAAAVVRTGRPADRRRADPRGVVPRAPPGTARRSIWPTSRRSRPRSAGGGAGACPQMRLFTLIETGTRVVFGLAGGPLATGEGELARALLDRLEPGMLCLADRGLVGSGAMPRRPGPTCCGGCAPTRSSRAAGGCPTAPS